MRIVHVVLSLDVGGQERLILSLSRVLRDRGHDVEIISFTRGGTLRDDFGPIHVIDVEKHSHFDLTLVPRLARSLRALRPAIVHTHNSLPLIYAAPAARAAGARQIVHTKHGANVYGRRSLFLSRLATRFVTRFVSVSEETAAAARWKEKPKERLHSVIPNGIPLGDFGEHPEARARIRAELGIPIDARVIGSVGRLVVEKNYPLLVRAAAPLLSNDVRLVLVGEGDVRAAVEASIPEEKRAFVTLTGTRRDVPALLAAFDLFALSSDTEGLPLVIPEAMASYLPIVSTAVGGVPGIVPKEVGVLVPRRDETAFRAALESLLGDGDLRKSLGRAARTYALSRFSLDRMADDYEAIYRGD